MTNTNEMKPKRPIIITSIAIFAALFGVISIKEGGSVLFTETGKLGAGDFVPFVVWFNFFAGFAYILAAIMLFRLKSCSRKLAKVIAAATVLVFIFFGLHIFNGGAYEFRTVIAMTLRSTIWIAIALFAHKSKVLKPTDCKC